LIPVSNYELDKVKNKIEAALVFSEVNNLAIAINLSMHEIIGDAARINSEIEKYRAVSALQIKQVSERILNPNRCCTVYYRSNNNKNDAS